MMAGQLFTGLKEPFIENRCSAECQADRLQCHLYLKSFNPSSGSPRRIRQ
jgi:hypothetical protein